MNAEKAVPVVRVRCPHCRAQIGTVWEVRNYHHAEPVFRGNADEPETRVVDLEDGLVVSTTWYRTGVRRPDVTPHDREWPVVPDTRLFVWCQRDGSFLLDHDEVTVWAAQARLKKAVITRVAKAAQRLDAVES